MVIKKTKEKGVYQIESKSSKGKFYDVNILNRTCTCPGFRFRRSCRHIQEVINQAYNQKSDVFDEIISYVKSHLEVDAITLIEKFGEDNVNELINRGEIIEERGKIKLL